MIYYVTGDATMPIARPALIMHVCNDAGFWRRGFVKALSARSTKPEEAYRAMATRKLGSVEFVWCTQDLAVANMIAQHHIHADACGNPPIRYEALARCLSLVLAWTDPKCSSGIPSSIHAPRLGCGLAGGSWDVVKPLISDILDDRQVYIYDLPPGSQ